MLRKCICLLCAMGLFPLMQVSAAEGSVRVMPMWAGKPVTGGAVSVQRVGTRENDKIVLTDGLADWCVPAEDLLEETWNIAGPAQTGSVEVQGAFFSGLEEGVYLVRQEQPAPGYFEFRSFLMVLPEDGQWNLLRTPEIIPAEESPRTGDQPAPIIGAMGIGLSVAFLMVLADKYNR